MIKAKEGTIKIKGQRSDIMAELTILLEQLEEQTVLDRQQIDECIKVSRMSKDEKMNLISERLIEAITWVLEEKEENDGKYLGN